MSARQVHPAIYRAQHRAVGLAATTPHPGDFLPAHCAGTSCTHAHPGEPAWETFAGLDVVDACCDRKAVHGPHDTDEGRCPGVRDTRAVPGPRIAEHAARARAALNAGGAR